MTDREYRARENRLYVRLLLLKNNPKLAAALAVCSCIACPVCGGILVRVPATAGEVK